MFSKRSGYKSLHGSRGHTLVELTISLSVIVVAFSAFLGVALESVHDYSFFSTLTRISQWNQQIVNDIRSDTLSTKMYLENNVLGQNYFNALNLPAAMPPLDSTRLPAIDEAGIFERDVAGSEKTGNGLFFVKTLAIKRFDDTFDRPGNDYVTEFTVKIGTAPGTNAVYRINAYRFLLYYLTRRVGETIGNCPDSIDLVRWASVPYLDYGQVMSVPASIQDPVTLEMFYPRDDLVTQFVAKYGSRYLWDSGEDVDNAFYYCDDFGVVDAAPEINMVIDQDPVVGFTNLVPNGMRNGKRTSICMNDGTPDFQAGPPVPVFAIADATGDGFPHGFETQIIGPSGARELLIRVALAKQASRSIIGREYKAILTTRDF